MLDDQLIYKPPAGRNGKNVIGWHFDKAYWSTCSSNNMLTAWIPFHDCDEAIGPIAVLDGSHKWSSIRECMVFGPGQGFQYQNLEAMEQRLHQEGLKVVRVPMTLKKGQVSFHHCWTIHGSFPNHSNRCRLNIAIHLQDEANRYEPCWNPKGEPIHLIQDSWCRKLPSGDPDYSDPDVFPVLYERD
jgi:ectoine hydroxylase-related dioxygenase (phytanoyl-CoA dioxygenase family)